MKLSVLIVFLIVYSRLIVAQTVIEDYFIDSLKTRISKLEIVSNDLKKRRNPQYYSVQQELKKAFFDFDFYMLLQNEELQTAEDLVVDNLNQSILRKDEQMTQFYKDKKEIVAYEIKLQKIKYQNLLGKEKDFKKKIDPLIKENSSESLAKASEIVNLAHKYAVEQNLEFVLKMLDSYSIKIKAQKFDLESAYDLKYLTGNKKHFIEYFKPLLESDSLSDIRMAEEIVADCHSYAEILPTNLGVDYFIRQRSFVDNAISQFFIREGMRMQGESVQASSLRGDSLNPEGVFKWNRYIVVITNFKPEAKFEVARKGEAILFAEKYLANYLRANDLGKLTSNDKVGRIFLIPYSNSGSPTFFFYDEYNDSYQMRVCYTMVRSKSFTETISKYLFPVDFEETPPKE